jgi:hypothetical protein
VREGKWKYIYAPYLDIEELYDIDADPAERHNLLARKTENGSASPTSPAASSTAAHEIAAKLRAELDAWSRGAHPYASRFDKEALEMTLRRLKGMGYPGGDEDSQGEKK